MGILDNLIGALRGRAQQVGDTSIPGGEAKQTFGQGGMAGRMNAERRKEYMMYQEEQATKGQPALGFNEWYAQRYGER
jgi:hypothetical protein